MGCVHRLLYLLLLAVGLLASPAPARAACDPAVRLVGPTELRAALRERLLRRGIPDAVPGCVAVPVEISREGDALTLTQLQDGTRRQVHDLETAATLVESWLRGDISAPLLDGRTLIVTPAGRPPSTSGRVQFAALAEAAVAVDRSVWLGGALRGCARVHRFCLGATLRAAGDLAPPATTGYTTQRLEVAALAGAALVLPVRGRVVLRPALGVGPGLQWTDLHGDPLAGSAVAWGLRAELGLGLSVRLVKELAADFALSLGAAYPAAPSSVLVTAYRDVHEGSDDPRSISLGAGPWGLLRAGLGLRWGTR